MTATIRDVARLAGTSVATVSAVINDSKYVSPELRRRVEEAIRVLNYRPNRVGRALATQRTHIVAYFVRSTTNPFFPSIIEAVEKAMFQRGYGLLVCNSEGQHHRAERYRDLLMSHADGVLINLSDQLVRREIYGAFLDRGKPVVGLTGESVIDDIDCVVSDDAGGFYQLTRYLIDLGHREFAFIGPRHTQRVEAVNKALADAGINALVHLPPQGPATTDEDGYRLTGEAFHGAFRPTALICFNDVLAMGALRWCTEHGLSVPHDVSITGCDETYSRFAIPRLTTIRIPVNDMGYTASTILLDRIEGKRHETPRVHAFSPELVIGESTGRAPAG